MCVQGPCQEEWRVSEVWKEEKHGLEFEAWQEEHGLELLQQADEEFEDWKEAAWFGADEAAAASSSSSLWHLPSYLVSYRLHMVDIGSG
jgi:hypothetical protein